MPADYTNYYFYGPRWPLGIFSPTPYRDDAVSPDKADKCGGCDDCACRPATGHVTHESGMVRSDDTGKPDYTTIGLDFLERLAVHMTANIESKGYNNWLNASTGEDVARAKRSIWRHLIAYMRGETDEDHAMALVYNVMVCEHARSQLAAPEHSEPAEASGALPPRVYRDLRAAGSAGD
jgi:hypothetical protein